jgi:hypothetical protein
LKDRHRLVGVLNVHEDRALWLNWRLLDANASEKGQGAHLVGQMVTEIRAAGSAQAIEWQVMDALYADGPLLAWLEYACGIRALVRLPEDRLPFQDLQGLAEGGLLEWETRTDVRYVSSRKQVRRVSIGLDESLTPWASFYQAAERYRATQPRLWGALICAVNVDDPDQTEGWAIVSSYAFASA